MARVKLAEGSNAQAKDLATVIIDAEAREIRATNKHGTSTDQQSVADLRRPACAGGRCQAG